ncbi:class I adenylate-forming enzyme family protein [Nocardia fusca]|uniref:class I adenylate-forming enzyme family protein n=1 Tax=Nocardia fusca TaxID=941183 RepID=UPI00379D90CE
MNFSSLPDRRAEQDPDGFAVADGSQSLTNAQLLDRVRAAAQHLRKLGISPGDVVALQLKNRAEFVVLLFAAWRLGATITPVNPNLTDIEVVRQLDDSGARLVVVEDGVAARGNTATVAVVEVDIDPLNASGALAPSSALDRFYRTVVEWAEQPRVDSSALALLIYTSGTTGVPKGVMLDHANIDAMAAMGVQALQLEPADRCLLILPLFHVNGIVVSVLATLLAGAGVVIAGRFDPRSFFALVERERPAFFSAVPTIYSMLAALPDDVRPDTSSLRFGICGAAPASAELLTRFETRYGFPLIEGYGLSEGTCGTTLNPLRGPRRIGTAGIPFPGQEIRIVDDSGCEVPVGVDGEITVRGPNVMRGYLGRPDDTARVLVDGWLHTGDIGHVDEDGYLTLVGRSKDMIIRGGENIYPKEIEDVLTGVPSILEAAVIGVPDERWGEVVVAYVQPRPGSTIDPADLKAVCAQHLTPYKHPTSFIAAETIPKNAVGKIDKVALRAAHASASTASV